MCERFSLMSGVTELFDRFELNDIRMSLRPRSDYAPTRTVPVIVNEQGQRKLEGYRWGLIPFWAKDAVLTSGADIQEKREYRKLFAKHRCVFPCDGFYVSAAEGKRRRYVRVSLTDRKTFGVAGFYEIWKDKQNGEFRTCTMMTTAANRLLYDYTERMPAILQERELKEWLDSKRNGEPDFLQSLLSPFPPERMRVEPVGADEWSGSSPDEDSEGEMPMKVKALLQASLKR
ncbi:SOS response-associated peptidase [Paenibacillus validus]|nr:MULTISPECIES: SOS response-associated peptidase [Paenibacillus]MED4603232.1 SOS response-associated peptidase [Paenibacillus validus]MED4604995.1 SOS response-associated peptidase [Paenibacillus validus]